MKESEKKAIEFVRKYKLKDVPTPTQLKDILTRQGFRIVSFNKYGPSTEKTENLLSELGIKEYSHGKSGFVYLTDAIRAVFLHDQLNEDEKLYVLLHEEGHIFCEHLFKKGGLSNTDTLKEQEADEFALYVMQYAKRRPIIRAASFAAVGVVALTLVMFTVARFLPADVDDAPQQITAQTFVTPSPTEITPPQTSRTVWLTSTNKYHKAKCSYRTQTAKEITIELAQQIGSPCKFCLPDDE